jgi:hypothetical protein
VFSELESFKEPKPEKKKKKKPIQGVFVQEEDEESYSVKNLVTAKTK